MRSFSRPRHPLLAAALLAAAALTLATLADALRASPLLFAPSTAAPGPLATTPLAAPDPDSAETLLADISEARVLLVDARSPSAFARGHLPGAFNLPRSAPRGPAGAARLRDEAGSRRVVVYCSSPSCNDSKILAEWLRAEAPGLSVEIYFGGYEEWTSLGLPVDTAP
jgi:rhodanese-related sulfurtransferase